LRFTLLTFAVPDDLICAGYRDYNVSRPSLRSGQKPIDQVNSTAQTTFDASVTNAF
jgi:hypothetical protein